MTRVTDREEDIKKLRESLAEELEELFTVADDVQVLVGDRVFKIYKSGVLQAVHVEKI